MQIRTNETLRLLEKVEGGIYKENILISDLQASNLFIAKYALKAN
jgi:hypothetical protein